MRMDVFRIGSLGLCLLGCSEMQDLELSLPPDGGTNPVLVPVAFTQVQLASPADTTHRQFGGLVAVRGDDVYVTSHASPNWRLARYTRDATGWTFAGQLRSEDFGGVEAFPEAITVDDDAVWVGVPNQGGRGEVWRFDRALSSATVVPEPENFVRFGTSLATSETALFVGATQRDTWAGAVFVYDLGGDLQTPEQTIPYPGTVRSAVFGHAVAHDGARLYVGAPSTFLSGGEGLRPGEVYVFEPDARGAWTRLATWAPEEPTLRNFGYSLAAAGPGQVLVGAPFRVDCEDEDEACLRHPGEAFLFSGEATASQRRALRPEPAWEHDERFGFAVAADGDTWVVGTPGDSSDSPSSAGPGGASDTGAAYVLSEGAPTRRVRGVPSFDQGQYGHAVAVHGDVVVVGAPRSKAPGTTLKVGRIAIFERVVVD